VFGAAAGEAVGAVDVTASAWGHQVSEIDECRGGQQLCVGDGGDELLITRPAAGFPGVGAEDENFVDVADLVAIPVVLFGILAGVVVRQGGCLALTSRVGHVVCLYDGRGGICGLGGLFEIENEVIGWTVQGIQPVEWLERVTQLIRIGHGVSI
jgi:hypothetical protein